MKQRNLIILILSLALVLAILLGVTACLPSVTPGDTTPTTIPAESTNPSQPTDATQGTEATVPITEPTVPPTEATTPSVPPTEPPPTEPDNEYIGKLYTRQELMAMENVNKGYGPGRGSNGSRPPYAESDQKKYGKYGANFIAPDNGCIYLTFDCGYEYNNLTADILDTLKAKNVKAVFFVTMQYVKDHPEYVQRMIDEGHAVGNHTTHHPAMPTLSLDKMVSEVMTLHNYILENFGYEMTLFRPPEGAFSTRTLAVVQSLGYKTVHWSFAYADWDPENQPDEVDALGLITRSHHSGAIYLLHAVSQTNANVLMDTIDYFRDQGYSLELFQ